MQGLPKKHTKKIEKAEKETVFGDSYVTREGKASEFSKSIAIKPEHHQYIEKIRYKKSRAGMLATIIDFYTKHPKHKKHKK